MVIHAKLLDDLTFSVEKVIEGLRMKSVECFCVLKICKPWFYFAWRVLLNLVNPFSKNAREGFRRLHVFQSKCHNTSFFNISNSFLV